MHHDREDVVIPWKGLERAITGGTHTIKDVREAIDARQMQLWLEGNSAVVTQVCRYPRLVSVEMFLMAGDLSELKMIEARIVDWAKTNGLDRVQLGGRSGWQRALPGYESLGVMLVKDI